MAKKEKEKKTDASEFKEQLFMKRRNTGLAMSDSDIAKADKFCEDYKKFLDTGKTEREACAEAIRLAERSGFVPFDKNAQYKAGDRVYLCNRGKSVILAVIGKKPVENGVNLVAAHIDSPRIDLKQNPLYENEGIAYFKTHYYGGIKKYQWPVTPLALHGVIYKADGSRVDVKVGEDEGDPVLVITDILPHLADEQYKRPAPKLIQGEELNILIGSRPFRDDKASETVKLNIMKILNEKYGIVESDFISAELECVPAYKAKDVGFDRSMVGAYGQDDRVCAYTALSAILAIKGAPDKTAVTVLTDKEEIGSVGATGMSSFFFENTVAKMMTSLGKDSFSATRRCLANSSMLSSDVSAGYDPLYADVYEKRSSAFLSCGLAFNKFTGSRGKSGSNDANAEYVAKVRRIMDDANVSFQFCELGKVDVGGGGTIAYIMAKYCMNVIDSGVPVLSMHAPYEVSSKADVYEAYKGYRAFLINA